MHPKAFPVKTMALVGHFSTGYAYIVLAVEALAMLILVPVFLWKFSRWLLTR